MLDKTVLDRRFTTKNLHKQSDTNNFLIVFNFVNSRYGSHFYMNNARMAILQHVQIW